MENKTIAKKVMSLRITSTAVTFCLVFAVTGHLAISWTIVVLDFVIKLPIYYLHEKYWQN